MDSILNHHIINWKKLFQINLETNFVWERLEYFGSLYNATLESYRFNVATCNLYNKTCECSTTKMICEWNYYGLCLLLPM